MKKEYVLVHGAGHGAWCWEAVAQRLNNKGHRVVSLDLPGHGRRASEYAKASVMTYARAVVDMMALNGISRALVVGHSMSGIVIPKVTELAAERVGHLVFLAAVVVPDRGNLADTHFTSWAKSAIRGLVQASGHGTYLYPAEAAWSRWMNDLPRHDPVVQAALRRLTPQPLRPLTERIDLKRFYAMSVPRTYIRCLKDVAVPPESALTYARRLGVRPVDLNAAHDVMLSAPDALVKILERL